MDQASTYLPYLCPVISELLVPAAVLTVRLCSEGEPGLRQGHSTLRACDSFTPSQDHTQNHGGHPSDQKTQPLLNFTEAQQQACRLVGLTLASQDQV